MIIIFGEIFQWLNYSIGDKRVTYFKLTLHLTEFNSLEEMWSKYALLWFFIYNRLNLTSSGIQDGHFIQFKTRQMDVPASRI